MKSVIMLSLLTLASCGSTMTRDVSERPQYAPRNYKQGGSVKYLNNGADFIISKRREDAFKQMYEACGGPDYRITREHSGKEGVSYNPNIFGGWSESGYNYVHLDFECLNKAALN